MRFANKYNDHVNAIDNKCANKLPKCKHGWYISKDDQDKFYLIIIFTNYNILVRLVLNKLIFL